MNCTLLQMYLWIVLNNIGRGRGGWIIYRNLFGESENFTGVTSNFGNDCSLQHAMCVNLC